MIGYVVENHFFPIDINKGVGSLLEEIVMYGDPVCSVKLYRPSDIIGNDNIMLITNAGDVQIVNSKLDFQELFI